MKRFANSVRGIGSGPLMVDAGTGMVEGGEERREIGCDEVGKVLVISRN